jgi:hypothetical protein
MPIVAIPIAPTTADPRTERNIYCTDEDIAVETEDYYFLCPRDQIDAYGTDGYIAADDPWALYSSVVDFGQNDVQPSTIAYLSTPDTVWGPDPGEAFAVSGVDPGTTHRVVLRRKGRGDGIGDPPGIGVEILGVTFTILSLRPQIIKATDIIDDRFGVSAALANDPTAAVDPVGLKRVNRACVYLVLAHQYMSISKGTTTPGAKEVWSEKSKFYQSLFDAQSVGMSIYLDDQNATGRNRRFSRMRRFS